MVNGRHSGEAAAHLATLNQDLSLEKRIESTPVHCDREEVDTVRLSRHMQMAHRTYIDEKLLELRVLNPPQSEEVPAASAPPSALEQPSLTCAVCGHQYKNKAGLTIHIKRLHPSVTLPTRPELPDVMKPPHTLCMSAQLCKT